MAGGKDKDFFSYRVVQKWNLLPVDLKMAPSLNCFKNWLDEKIMRVKNPARWST